MARKWGRGADHGPGGDPSWLGGKDRGPDAGAPSADAGGDSPRWSSDFGPDESTVQGTGAEEPEVEGPRFGEWAEPEDGADSQSSPGSDGEDIPDLAHLGRQLVGPVIALVVIATITISSVASGSGFSMFILIAAVPLLTRVGRTVQRYLRSR